MKTTRDERCEMFHIVIVSIVLLFCLVTNVAAVELWNGFTTDMSKNDAFERAKELLPDGEYLEYVANDAVSVPGFRSPKGCAGLLFSNTKSDVYDSFAIYFYDDKMLSIYIGWKADQALVINQAKRQFGEPNETKRNKIPNKNGDMTEEIFRWNQKDRFLVIEATVFKNYYFNNVVYTVRSTFINRNLYNDWESGVIQAEQKKKQEEEDRRKRANSGVTF